MAPGQSGVLLSRRSRDGHGHDYGHGSTAHEQVGSLRRDVGALDEPGGRCGNPIGEVLCGYFRVTPPTVHNMILELEELGLIRHQPGRARAIEVLVPPNERRPGNTRESRGVLPPDVTPLRLLLITLCTGGCTTAVSTDPIAPPPKAEPAVAPKREDPPAAEAKLEPGDLTGPLRFDPAEAGDGRLPAANEALLDESGAGTMMDHPEEFGWATDGKSFGWCLDNGARDCDDCRLVGVDGKEKKFERGPECNRNQTKAVAAEWSNRGIGTVPIAPSWRFGRDIVVTWYVVAGAEAPDPAQARLAKVLVGASVAGEPPVYFLEFDEPEMRDYAEYDIFPELVIPSPDGSRLAILTHAFAGEYSDTVRLHVASADEFARAAYERTAEAVRARNPARATELTAIADSIAKSSSP